jgi:nitric oxide reductase activation protein
MSKSKINEHAKSMMEKLMPSMSMGSEEDGASTEEMLKDFVEDMEEKSSSLSKYNPEEMEAGISTGDSTVYFQKSHENKESYQRSLSKIDTTKAAVLQKLFMRKNKDYQFAMKSMRSGRLDTNKIAEAVQRVPTVYERYGQVTTDKICVTVLIDESGSMSGSKIIKAREAAIFINEVFKKIPNVELFIYGHTADQGKDDQCTNVIIYKEPGYNETYALGNVSARSNNRDGDAILATAKRVRNFTKNNGLMFVLSDGQPSAYGYGGSDAIADTRKKVTMAQNLGFQIIQIAIEEAVPSSQMFDYFIKMTNIKNLPKDLIGYMSRKVDKLIKERVLI